MTQKSVRAGFYAKKRKLSKYETSIEDSFKQKKFYTATVDDVSVLTYVPDVVIVPDQDNSSTALVLPVDDFSNDKVVEVVNNDAAEAVTVGGATCPCAETTFIDNAAGTWTVLYSVAHA